MNTSEMVPVEAISQKIFIIRGVKVMLSTDLAEIYRVESRSLIQAVKRNSQRFPSDFMFQLTLSEAMSLKSQFVISNVGRGGRRHTPYAFTEHGVAMLSAVLKSERAIEMSVFIVRAFIKLRELLASNKDLAYKVDELEREQQKQGEHIGVIHELLKKLIEEPVQPKDRIGFNR